MKLNWLWQLQKLLKPWSEIGLRQIDFKKRRNVRKRFAASLNAIQELCFPKPTIYRKPVFTTESCDLKTEH